jgi:fermentation-respiration switch protein FrsA (DUF1100 family)
MRRSEVWFDSWGERCAAWLYEPAGEAPHPCVVMAHGFAGVREARLDAFAERFAEAGIAALVFDYRHFGASEGEPRQLVDIGRQLADWAAAIAYARAHPELDPERIALWGTSFSGGHVIATAARDRRVAAVVSQAPFIDGPATLRAGGMASALRLTRAGVIDEWRRLRGREPYRLKVVGPPGSVAAMTSPDAEPGYRAIVPSDSSWVDEVPARIALRIGSCRPGRLAGQVRCPLLVCVCDADAVTPPEPALRAAQAAPRGEQRRYPIGHFDIYVGEWFERAAADQAEFLSRHLLPSPERAAVTAA